MDMGIRKTSELDETGPWRGWWWGPERRGQCSAVPPDHVAHRALGRGSESIVLWSGLRLGRGGRGLRVQNLRKHHAQDGPCSLRASRPRSEYLLKFVPHSPPPNLGPAGCVLGDPAATPLAPCDAQVGCVTASGAGRSVRPGSMHSS